MPNTEGSQLKPETFRVVVRGNQVFDAHHEDNTATMVSVEGSESPSGDYLIENNRIWNIRQVKHSVAGVAFGHGNAIIRNNYLGYRRWNGDSR